MTRYEHTQIGHVMIWSVLAIVLILDASIGHRAPPLIISAILLVCLVLFYRLKIMIDPETLCASFGIGIIRKRVRLADIVGCDPIRIHWWYGWGIPCDAVRLALQCFWLDAVGITLRNGKKSAFGSNDPDGLMAGIRDAIRAS